MNKPKQATLLNDSKKSSEHNFQFCSVLPIPEVSNKPPQMLHPSSNFIHIYATLLSWWKGIWAIQGNICLTKHTRPVQSEPPPPHPCRSKAHLHKFLLSALSSSPLLSKCCRCILLYHFISSSHITNTIWENHTPQISNSNSKNIFNIFRRKKALHQDLN